MSGSLTSEMARTKHTYKTALLTILIVFLAPGCFNTAAAEFDVQEELKTTVQQPDTYLVVPSQEEIKQRERGSDDCAECRQLCRDRNSKSALAKQDKHGIPTENTRRPNGVIAVVTVGSNAEIDFYSNKSHISLYWAEVGESKAKIIYDEAPLVDRFGVVVKDLGNRWKYQVEILNITMEDAGVVFTSDDDITSSPPVRLMVLLTKPECSAFCLKEELHLTCSFCYRSESKLSTRWIINGSEGIHEEYGKESPDPTSNCLKHRSYLHYTHSCSSTSALAISMAVHDNITNTTSQSYPVTESDLVARPLSMPTVTTEDKNCINAAVSNWWRVSISTLTIALIVVIIILVLSQIRPKWLPDFLSRGKDRNNGSGNPESARTSAGTVASDINNAEKCEGESLLSLSSRPSLDTNDTSSVSTNTSPEESTVRQRTLGKKRINSTQRNNMDEQGQNTSNDSSAVGKSADQSRQTTDKERCLKLTGLNTRALDRKEMDMKNGSGNSEPTSASAGTGSIDDDNVEKGEGVPFLSSTMQSFDTIGTSSGSTNSAHEQSTVRQRTWGKKRINSTQRNNMDEQDFPVKEPELLQRAEIAYVPKNLLATKQEVVTDMELPEKPCNAVIPDKNEARRTKEFQNNLAQTSRPRIDSRDEIAKKIEIEEIWPEKEISAQEPKSEDKLVQGQTCPDEVIAEKKIKSEMEAINAKIMDLKKIEKRLTEQIYMDGALQERLQKKELIEYREKCRSMLDKHFEAKKEEQKKITKEKEESKNRKKTNRKLKKYLYDTKTKIIEKYLSSNLEDKSIMEITKSYQVFQKLVNQTASDFEDIFSKEIYSHDLNNKDVETTEPEILKFFNLKREFGIIIPGHKDLLPYERNGNDYAFWKPIIKVVVSEREEMSLNERYSRGQGNKSSVKTKKTVKLGNPMNLKENLGTGLEIKQRFFESKNTSPSQLKNNSRSMENIKNSQVSAISKCTLLGA